MYKIDCGTIIKPTENTVVEINGQNTSSISRAKGAIVVRVPVMGESITTGILAKWISNVDEIVVLDQVIGSIETDKVRKRASF